MHGKYNSTGPTRRSTAYDKADAPADGDSVFAKVMKKASNMRLSNMASTAVDSTPFGADEAVRSGVSGQPPLMTTESSVEKLVKSPMSGQVVSTKPQHPKKRRSAAGMSPVASAHGRSLDFPEEDRAVSHTKTAKVARMREDNDKLLRAYERGMINAKSPAIGGTAKHHRRQASSHKRNAGLSPAETHHEGTQSKLADQVYYSTKKEWNKASPYH